MISHYELPFPWVKDRVVQMYDTIKDIEPYLADKTKWLYPVSRSTFLKRNTDVADYVTCKPGSPHDFKFMGRSIGGHINGNEKFTIKSPCFHNTTISTKWITDDKFV